MCEKTGNRPTESLRNIFLVWKPYTAASVPLTGYVDEPWHGRWVGANLASALQSLGYQAWPDISADDVIAALRSEAGLDDGASLSLAPKPLPPY